MARTRFIDWVVTKLPPLMQTSKTISKFRALVDAFDGAEYRADQAVKQRLPLFAGDRALAALGAERGLPRFPGESRAAYGVRLTRAFEQWAWAGTPTGLLRALTGMGYPNALVIVQNGTVYGMDGSGNLVTAPGIPFTFTTPGWNRFYVLFPTPLPDAWVSGGVPAFDSDEANRIRVAVNRWKWGNAAFDGVLIEVYGELWDYPPGTWSDAGTWDASWTSWAP